MILSRWLMMSFAGSMLLMVGCGFSHAPCFIGATKSQPLKPELRAGPYCGAYCMYASMHLLGSDIDVAQLLKAKYFNARKGSALSDLESMARDNGFSTLCLSHLNWDSLRSVPLPIILHLNRSRYKNYHHYVVYAGSCDGMAIIHDPPYSIRRIPIADLLVDWDGIGVIVAKESIPKYAIHFWSWVRLCSTFLGILVVVALLGKGLLPHASVGRANARTLWEFVLIGGVALGAAFLFHMYAAIGFYANQPALNQVYMNSMKSLLPKVRADEVARLIKEPDVLLVDARWKTDFNKGHLPAATSIEPNASLEQVRESTVGSAMNARVIVYCQSSSCDYAPRVAHLLQLAGYHNVLYFKEGWRGWIEHEATEGKN